MDQSGQRRFKAYAVTGILGVCRRDPNGVHGEIHGGFQRPLHGLPPHQGSAQGRGEDVSRAVEGGGKIVGEIFREGVGFGVICHGALLVFGQDHAGQNRDLASESAQALEHVADPFTGVARFSGEFLAQHQTSLGQVRVDHVCLGADPLHLLGKVGSKARVELSVVCHGGIHEDQIVLGSEALEQNEPKTTVTRGNDLRVGKK